MSIIVVASARSQATKRGILLVASLVSLLVAIATHRFGELQTKTKNKKAPAGCSKGPRGALRVFERLARSACIPSSHYWVAQRAAIFFRSYNTTNSLLQSTTGARPDDWRGVWRSNDLFGRETDQTADLGHGWAGEFQENY